MKEISQTMKPSDLVAEYIEKTNSLPGLYESFVGSTKNLEMGCSIMGQYGGNIWQGSSPTASPSNIESALLKSAWKRVYYAWIKDIATAKDKARIQLMLENPPEFTINNIRNQFGDYIADPWGTVLRGLAEVFCGLDQAYKSHSKVKIGADGLPKRVIIRSCGGFHDYGRDKLTDIVNALRAYRRQSLASYSEISNWMKAAEVNSSELDDLTLTIYKNSNGHVKFGKDALFQINKALAQYYGEVLPDVEEKSTKKQFSKEVSKDLQYYPTPKIIADGLVGQLGIIKRKRVLEPSCGCGRIMDSLIKSGANVQGVEVDPTRANQARAKGHATTIANFLELEPSPEFDAVIMNPPFYGKHYIKHIETAIKWLKPGGHLVSILPASARYDHKLINKKWLDINNVRGSRYDMWRDLPVGSFSESGTNINTVTLQVFKETNEMKKAA